MKRRNRTRTSETSGLPPGTLVHVGEMRTQQVEIAILDYGEGEYTEKSGASVEDCAAFLDSESVTWINVVGLHDIGILKSIGESFQIHPLVMEDILNTEQRPKIQDMGDCVLVLLKMYRPCEGSYESEQVGLILKNQCVLTFQEQKGDVFDPIRERVRANKGIVRKSKADYLLYALIDSVVDGYFPYLERMSELLEETEARILESPDIVSLRDLHTKKQELIAIRKIVWPVREITSYLEHGDSPLIDPATYIYLRDVYEHVIQIADTTESLRDVVSGLLEIYLSTSSFKTNEVMKVLTIIATIFIPLTFVVGIYGMNFAHMPELGMKEAYPIVLGGMAVIAGGMIIYFKRKKWL
jgi:magnesium transporter